MPLGAVEGIGNFININAATINIFMPLKPCLHPDDFLGTDSTSETTGSKACTFSTGFFFFFLVKFYFALFVCFLSFFFFKMKWHFLMVKKCSLNVNDSGKRKIWRSETYQANPSWIITIDIPSRSFHMCIYNNLSIYPSIHSWSPLTYEHLPNNLLENYINLSGCIVHHCMEGVTLYEPKIKHF